MEGGADALRVVLLLLALVPLLPPLREDAPPTWALGDVAPRAVIAEFAFPVLRDRSEFEAELQRLRGEIPAILARDDTARVGSRHRVAALRAKVETLRATWDPSGPDSLALGLDPETSLALVVGERGPHLLALIGELADEVERRGLISAELRRDLDLYRTVTIVGGPDPVPASRESLLSPSSLRDSAAVAARQRRLPQGPALALVEVLFTPNLIWQREETEALVERAESAVPRHRRFVRRGEKIVGANEVVSEEVRLALESYAFWWGLEDRSGRGVSGIVDRGARLLLGALAAGLALAVLESGRRAPRRPHGRLDERTLFALLVAGGLLVSFVLLRLGGLSPLLLPAAGVGLAASLFLGVRSGRLAGLLLATLLALPAGVGSTFWAVQVAGATVVAGMRPHDPGKLARAAVLGSVVQVATLLALLGAGLAVPQMLVRELLAAGLGPVVGVALAWAGVATVERRARWATPLGITEVTTVDHPLLARLQTEAPGTYAHSVRVATLADAAARAVGADGRLARAIGYHHDVGKLARPGEFEENGAPPLEAERAMLLRAMHVREGVALAEEARLPHEIVLGIAEHHGRELGAEAAVPTFPESAAVLLANRAAHVAPGPDGTAREELEKVLFHDGLVGELAQSGLSLGDLETMKREIVSLWRSWEPRGREDR